MKKTSLILAALLLFGITAFAGKGREEPPRHILAKAWANVDKSIVQPGGDFFPYPAYSDRDGWNKLFGEQKADIIKAGEKNLDYEWKILKATDYLEFERSGSRSIMSSPLGANERAFKSLFYAELAEGKGRFIDQIANWVWLQTERTSWIASAHQIYQKSKRALPDSRDLLVDIYAQRTGVTVALALHFFRDQLDALDPSIAAAAERAIKRNIFDPYLDEDKYNEQTWLGYRIKDDEQKSVNNWNPWCNAHVLLTFLLVEKDRDTLLKAFEKATRSTDVYMDKNKLDGGCDEGAGYWGHASGSLFDFIQIANYATKGTFGCFDDPQFVAMGVYKSRVFMGNGWTANFGDGSDTSLGECDLVYRYGKSAGIPEMVNYAIYVSNHKGNFGSWKISQKTEIFRSLEVLKYNPEFKKDCDAALKIAGGDKKKMNEMLLATIPSWTWYKNTEHFFYHGKDGWSFAAKGGYNAESHNHNDVGSCVLVVKGAQILVDAGVGDYTRQTFSKERYNIWTMQSQYHNTPSINGVQQHNGLEFTASEVKANESARTLKMNLAKAYEEEAACNSWYRTYQMKDASVVITDEFNLKERKGSDVINFLTKAKTFLPGDEYDGGKVKKGEIIFVVSMGKKEEPVRVRMTFSSSLTPSFEWCPSKKSGKETSHTPGKSMARILFTSSDKAPVKGKYVFTFTEL